MIAVSLACLMTFVCETAWSQNGVILNQTFAFSPGAVHTFLIATLPASADNTADHLHLLATLNVADSGNLTSYIDASFGNRRGFTYLWTMRGLGPQSDPTSKLVAYQAADGSVNLYLIFGDAFDNGGYTILEAEDDTIYTNPSDLGPSTPGGTLVFDTSNPAYAPAQYIDFTGSSTFHGNLKMQSGSGASMTFPDGTVQSTAWNGTLCGGDYAESVDVRGDHTKYEPGDLIVIDDKSPGRFTKSDRPYSPLVAGIYSTKPGLIGRRTTTGRIDKAAEIPMAMTGIVPIKVSTENGPIRTGDLLVSSATKGFAMRGTDKRKLAGAVIGKALGPLEAGSGTIEALVALQ